MGFCCFGGDDASGDKAAASGKYAEVRSPETRPRGFDNAPGGGSSSPTSEDEFHDAHDTLEAMDAHGRGASFDKKAASGGRRASSDGRRGSADRRRASASSDRGGPPGSSTTSSDPLDDPARLDPPLETREVPTSGVGRCLIPRRDIPFATPEAGSPVSWSANPTGRGFNLRGKHYRKDRKKYPSAPPLFEVVEVLALRSDRRTLDIGDVVYGDERVGECVHGCPTVYIANLMLPDYAPPNPVWGAYDRAAGPDGPGQHVIVIARMTRETRDELERCGGDAAKMRPDVGLMARHFRGEGIGGVRPTDLRGLEEETDAPPHLAETRRCTKMVCMVAAGSEELPWAARVAIGQGNGKPFMVNRTGFFVKKENKGTFEIGVNAHNFGPVATNGLRNCHTFFKKLTLDIGVTLQGADESELPERLLFSFRAVKPNLDSITVHVDELEADAAANGKGRNARPWLNWEGLAFPGRAAKTKR